MLNKQQKRQRRSRRIRAVIKNTATIKLSVHRTARHIYAQIIELRTNDVVLAAASSLEKKIADIVNYPGNVSTAKLVGELIAERALNLGIKQVAFDRAGYKYHGRIKALADGAREKGLII